MFRIIDLDKAASVPMENGRGDTLLLVDGTMTDKIDLHLNRLVAGGPNGSLHRHTVSDNIYIVKSGEGRLRIEDETVTIKAGQIIYIPAGAKHSLSNVSNELFEIFEIYTPAGKDFDFVLSEGD
ncbi:MAG: cupin 2 conserved barrel protein [Hyphomicrobiales bacterium]|jgi:mannose-6-phosphate isomerase-like protein (cupin superfamily)|nr:cupin 2 conserved barrel protein [Hyphomicrobiales bacterium]